MASSQYGGGAGGKFQKRSRRAAANPYDRPQSAIRRPNLNPNSNSSWFSKIVDPASKLIAKGASMFFASVFQKRLVAPPITIPEENLFGHGAPGDAASLQNPLDVAPESGGNIMDNATSNSKTNGTLDTNLNAADDCKTKKEPTSSLNGVFDIEQLLKQKTFTRAEFDRLASLLRSRTIESKSILEEGAVSTEKGKEIQQSIIEPSTSQPLRGEKGERIFSEQQNKNKSSTLQGNNTNLAVNVHIPDEAGISPEQIAREYMGSRTPKPSNSTLGGGSKKSESPNFPIVPFSKNSRMPLFASRNSSSISGIHEHPQNSYMTPRPRGRSAVYKNSRSPYFRASLGSNGRDGLAHVSTSSPFISSIGTHSSNKQAAKRGRSVLENDIELHDPMRRTRQKPSLISQGQRESSYSLGQVSRGLDNKNRTNLFHVPTKSTEMALKIIQQLDKLEASPREKLSETKGSGDGDMASSSTLKLVNSLSPKNDKLKVNSQSDAISAVKSDAVIPSSAATPSIKEAAVQTAKDKTSPEVDAFKNSSNIASVISATDKKKSTDKPLSSFNIGMPSSSILKIKDDAKEASNKPATKKRVDFSIPVSTSKPSPERKETSPVPNSSQEGSLSRTPSTTLESSENDKKIKKQSDSSQINGASTSTSSPISVSFGSPTSFIANSSASKVSFGTLAEPKQDSKTSIAPSFTLNSSASQGTSNAFATTQKSGNGIFGFSAAGTQSSGFGLTSQATQPTAFSNQSSVSGFTSQATKPTAFSNQSSVSGFTSQATKPTFGLNNSTTKLFSSSSQPTSSMFSSDFASKPSSSFTSAASQPPSQPIFGFSKQTQNSPVSGGMKVDDSTTNNKVQTTPIFGSNSQFTLSATEAGSQPVFQFGGNGSNSSAPPNSSPFQTPGNFQFSANEGFSLGSGGAGGGDKAGRRIVKVRRDKHKKK